MEVVHEEEQKLTAQALNGLVKVPGIRLFGITDTQSEKFSRKGTAIAFDFKTILPGRLAGELSRHGGIGVRYGCHCAHLLVKHLVGIPPRLEKVQRMILIVFPKVRLPGVVRISLGIGNSAGEVDRFLDEMMRITAKRK
jgi:selenocysteine lyase/cysteine desulfurase